MDKYKITSNYARVLNNTKNIINFDNKPYFWAKTFDILLETKSGKVSENWLIIYNKQLFDRGLNQLKSLLNETPISNSDYKINGYEFYWGSAKQITEKHINFKTKYCNNNK